MSNFKKFFAITVGIMTVFGVVGFVPTGAKAAMAGDLIKMAGNPAVYYFDGTKRYVFPQENVYKSWYKDFSGVQTISQSELQSYPIGGNVTMRPGTWMVKIQTDPKVYAVEPGGKLRHVDSEARALALYGPNWNKMIVDVSDAFFVNYTMGTALNSDTHPTGTVIKRGSQYYYVDNGTERPFASEAALAANKINTAFAVETTMDYPDGSSITGAEEALTNVAGSASSSSTSAAGLTVSGGAMTASTSLPQGAGSVKIGTWNFTAGSEGAVNLGSVTFKRIGVGAVADISAAYLYDGANRLTSGRTFNSSTNEATFTLNLNVPAGSTKMLTLYVSTNTSATGSGNQHAFTIEAASKVTSNAASVNGVFPISSNYHTIAGASAGTVTVTGVTGLSNPRVGDKGVKVAQFRLDTSGSSEDAWVNQVTLTQGGNISNSAMSNFVLKQAGSTVATASAIASNDRLDLVFNPAFKIEKGNNRIFELYADINGRPGDKIKFYLDEEIDLMATGGTYGVGMAISSTYSGEELTLEGGQFTITFDGPSASNIANTANDVVVWKGSFYSANQVEVRNVRITIADSNSGDAGNVDLVQDTNGNNVYNSGETVYVQDIKLWNLDNNTVIAGPVELAAGGTNSAYTQDLVLTEDFTLNAGQTMNVGISVDIRNTPAAGIDLEVSLRPFETNDIKNVGSNTYLAPATDIVPNTTISGQKQTVVAGGLTVSTAASPTAHSMIKGTSNHTAAAYNFTAGSGTAVKVNSIRVLAETADTNFSGTGVTVNNLILSAKLMDGTTQVGPTRTFTGGYANFDNLNYTIPASQTKKLDVVITTNSAASLTSDPDFLRFTIQTGDVQAVDSEGNTLGSIPSSAQQSSVITVKNSGTLTAAVAPTPTNPSAKLIAGGSTDQVLAAFRFEAVDESFNVRKFQLITSVAANTARLSQAKIRYPKQGGGTETRTIGLSGTSTTNNIDISDMPMYVPQNGNATLEVLGDAALFGVLDGTESVTLSFTLKGSDATNNQATGVASNQSVTNFGSNAAGNAHLFVRTILSVAAGSGTPNNTARVRQPGQKVASYNLSASSSSNAFLRGSKKAQDSALTSWAATDADNNPALTTSAGEFISGASAVKAVSTSATASVLAYNFGAAANLDTYQRVSAWVKIESSAGHDATVTFAVDDNDALLGSPQGSVAVGTTSATATWYYIDVTTASLFVTSATQYVGVKATAATGGVVTMIVDDLRFYRDSVTLDVAGSLGTTATVQGLLFTLKDSGGTIRAYGAFNGTGGATGTGTVVLIPGDGADVAATTDYSNVEISTSTLALDVETNTTTLVGDVANVNDTLSVSIGTGTTTSAGSFRWYDNSDSSGGNNMPALTAVNPLSTTISFSNTY